MLVPLVLGVAALPSLVPLCSASRCGHRSCRHALTGPGSVLVPSLGVVPPLPALEGSQRHSGSRTAIQIRGWRSRWRAPARRHLLRARAGPHLPLRRTRAPTRDLAAPRRPTLPPRRSRSITRGSEADRTTPALLRGGLFFNRRRWPSFQSAPTDGGGNSSLLLLDPDAEEILGAVESSAFRFGRLLTCQAGARASTDPLGERVIAVPDLEIWSFRRRS